MAGLQWRGLQGGGRGVASAGFRRGKLSVEKPMTISQVRVGGYLTLPGTGAGGEDRQTTARARVLQPERPTAQPAAFHHPRLEAIQSRLGPCPDGCGFSGLDSQLRDNYVSLSLCVYGVGR